MRLFHFTTERYGLQAIQHQRLKVARVRELNDPFEFLGPVFDSVAERRRMAKNKAEVDRDFGLICLGTDWSHPLLWGHYAEKHRGICLGFDILQPSEFEAVEYVDERPAMKEFGITSLDQLDEESQKRLFHVKFKAWEYEREYRTFIDLSATDHESGSDLHFVPFHPTMRLAQVIMGHRSTASRADVAAALGSRDGSVEVFKSRPAFQKFEVVRNWEMAAWE